uniref:HECT-type E3 ubiquitin transferase E3D n=1 Tax=Hyaloperonospora arabidopsidis (strain Emoy2) TaxID=559515 RepID=M4BUQ2_HYAAE
MADASTCASENELIRPAADGLVNCLETLNVTEHETGNEWSAAPRIVDSLVEYNANIGCYQCFLFLSDDRHRDDGYKLTNVLKAEHLRVRVAFPHAELGYNDPLDHSVDTIIWETEIERNVDVTQCTVEQKDDHWYLRLPIRLSDKQPLGGFSSFTMVSPLELRVESYGSLSCRTCKAQLLDCEDSVKMDKVLPLPSANWMDMFDFWGAGIGAFEHIPRDHIYAQRHRVLVGESYILLHASDLVAKATTVADGEGEATVAPGDNAKEEREWIPLTCAKCSERVGLRNVEQPDTVRLHKHVLIARQLARARAEKDLVEQDQEAEDVFGKYTIDSILSAKLLEMADSDGIFRFVLTPSNDKHDCVDLSSGNQGGTSALLQLQLLSWETMIKQHGSNKFRRVLKVLYGGRQSTSTIQELLPVHTVLLPPTMCLTIADRLQASSKLLPSSLRTFNRMNVGYLYN